MIKTYALTRIFEGGLVKALDGVDFTLGEGEAAAIMGPSGSGKSTLLNIVGTLDRPTSGEVHYDGKKLGELGSLSAWRAKNLGFVFQFHHLVPTMTLLENAEAALRPLRIRAPERKRRAGEELERLGVSHRADFFPSKVSGGERQRAAIARALAGEARLMLADEPTGQLDHENGMKAARILFDRCREKGVALLVVTHNPEVAALAPRILKMMDGRLDSWHGGGRISGKDSTSCVH